MDCLIQIKELVLRLLLDPAEHKYEEHSTILLRNKKAR